MKTSSSKKWLMMGLSCLLSAVSFAQVTNWHNLTLDQAVDMAMGHHQQLKLSGAKVQLSRDQEEVSRQQILPSATFSANAFYLGDALVLDKDFSKVQTVEMPNFGNSFSVQASQLLYKGGAIRKSLELASLQTQLSELHLENDVQAIKFLVISR